MLIKPEQRYRAFEMVVNKYNSRLYWYIRHIVLSHEDTNDILQNTFVKAWNNLESFRGESKLFTWLYKIAYNESLTFLKQQRKMLEIDDLETELYNTLESDAYFEGEEIDKKLQAAILTLPMRQRQVFNMKYFQNIKYEEMSELLDISEGALKASYHIAVQKIEDYLKSND